MIKERTKKEVIFRLPSNTNMDELQNIANLFEFESIGKKSKATQRQVDSLAKQIKKGRWSKTKLKMGL